MDKHYREKTRAVPISETQPRPEQAVRSSVKGLLTVIQGGDADLGRIALVDGSVVLGRDPSVALTLHDPGISWHHALVRPQPGDAFLLEDLGSTNGTRLEGQPVQQPTLLTNGQKIFLSETVVRFSLVDEMELDFQREVEQLVSTDPLTGLESKRLFDGACERSLERAREVRQCLAILMMDLDGIKPINDAYGHLYGAHCIRVAGQIIGRVLGQVGHACRFGGDEFTAFVYGCDATKALRLAEKIRAEIEAAAIEKDGRPMRVTISIGVAVFPEHGQKVLDLIASADAALYRAKSGGKNRVAI